MSVKCTFASFSGHHPRSVSSSAYPSRAGTTASPAVSAARSCSDVGPIDRKEWTNFENENKNTHSNIDTEKKERGTGTSPGQGPVLAIGAVFPDVIARRLKRLGLLHRRRPGHMGEFRLPDGAAGGDLLAAAGDCRHPDSAWSVFGRTTRRAQGHLLAQPARGIWMSIECATHEGPRTESRVLGAARLFRRIAVRRDPQTRSHASRAW
jgi:hypothetical protein